MDKIIALDSPPEETGALNMIVAKNVSEDFGKNIKKNILKSVPNTVSSAAFFSLVLTGDFGNLISGVVRLACYLALDEIGDAAATLASVFIFLLVYSSVS